MLALKAFKILDHRPFHSKETRRKELVKHNQSIPACFDFPYKLVQESIEPAKGPHGVREIRYKKKKLYVFNGSTKPPTRMNNED